MMSNLHHRAARCSLPSRLALCCCHST